MGADTTSLDDLLVYYESVYFCKPSISRFLVDLEPDPYPTL